MGASCAVKGSKTLVSKKDLRIYRKGGAVYGCSKHFGKHVKLEGKTKSVDLYARAGKMLAYATPSHGPEVAFGSVNLKAGVRVRHYVTSGYTEAEAEKLVVKKDGSIAFIYYWLGSNTHDAGDDVWKDDKTGSMLLDSDCVLCGNMIDTTFLQVQGNTVLWKDNGTIRSAPFK